MEGGSFFFFAVLFVLKKRNHVLFCFSAILSFRENVFNNMSKQNVSVGRSPSHLLSPLRSIPHLVCSRQAKRQTDKENGEERRERRKRIALRQILCDFFQCQTHFVVGGGPGCTMCRSGTVMLYHHKSSYLFDC